MSIPSRNCSNNWSMPKLQGPRFGLCSVKYQCANPRHMSVLPRIDQALQQARRARDRARDDQVGLSCTQTTCTLKPQTFSLAKHLSKILLIPFRRSGKRRSIVCSSRHCKRKTAAWSCSSKWRCALEPKPLRSSGNPHLLGARTFRITKTFPPPPNSCVASWPSSNRQCVKRRRCCKRTKRR